MTSLPSTLHALLLAGVAVVTLAALARITRLVTGDTITEPIRQRIDAKAMPRGNGDGTARLAPAGWRFLAGIVRCHWCASIWIAAPGTGAYMVWATGTPLWQWNLSTVFLWVAAWFASSQVIGTAADWLDSPPPVKQHEVTLHQTSR